MLSEVRIAILAGAAEVSLRSSSRIFESTYAATSPMYSGSAPLILYSLPKIVTLSVSGSVAMRIPSDLCLGDGPGPGGAGPWDHLLLGVHRFFEYGKLDQHLLHPPRHRAALVEQRSALLLERVQPGLPVRRFLFADRVLQGSHALLELAVLVAETIQKLGGRLNLSLQLVQFGDHRHVQGRPAAVDSTPPLRVARTADPSARTTFWTASSTSLSSSVRSGERNSSAYARLFLPDPTCSPSKTSNSRTLTRSPPPPRRIVSSTSPCLTARSTRIARSRLTAGYFGRGWNRLRDGTRSAIAERSRTAAQAGRSRPVVAASRGATCPSRASLPP